MKSWWIDEPVVLGSSNPTTEQLAKLFQEGFRSIFSLLDEREYRPNYDVSEVVKLGYDRFKIEIRDYFPPTLQQFKDFSSNINRAVKKGKVLVHCQGGHGRTGTMAAAYWISKGLTAEQAITKVRQINPLAIETKEQKESLYLLG